MKYDEEIDFKQGKLEEYHCKERRKIAVQAGHHKEKRKERWNDTVIKVNQKTVKSMRY